VSRTFRRGADILHELRQVAATASVGGTIVSMTMTTDDLLGGVAKESLAAIVEEGNAPLDVQRG
jgi:hypothetical protein